MTLTRWLGWAAWPALGYGGLCLVMFLHQRSFIYFPTPAADPTNQLELRVEGTRVLVAERPRPGPRALIYFGGNAEDVSLTRAELAALLPDTSLFLLHYRGYGGSEGTPSEAAIRADAQALYAHVNEAVVPVRHAQALSRAFRPGVAELVVVPDLEHNAPILEVEAFRTALRAP